MNKDLLKKFDDFVKSEKLDPYEILISLMERALERASRKLWAISGEVPGEIHNTLRYVAFNCSENRIQFSESIEDSCYDTLRSAGLEENIFIENDKAFIEEDSDYQLLSNKFLEVQKKAKLEREERDKKEKERLEKLEVLRQLLELDLTNEQILERLYLETNS